MYQYNIYIIYILLNMEWHSWNIIILLIIYYGCLLSDLLKTKTMYCSLKTHKDVTG
jgi:hypothetical protein